MNDEQMRVNVSSMKSIYIDVYYNEQKLSTASGFLVNKDGAIYLITNRHVVTGRNNETGECLDEKFCAIPNKLMAWFPHIEYKENEKYYRWSKINIELYDDKEQRLWKEHPNFKEKVDVVAIMLGHYDQFQFCYDLNSRYEPTVTEKVYIIGYPFGYDLSPQNGKYAMWITGSVASDPVLDLNIKNEQMPAFLVDARTRQGQSGSPVVYYSREGLDYQNNGIALYGSPILHEIGIYSGRINKDSDLGYVWKWSLLSEIINGDN